MDLISVVIPVYNVEKYIHQCVDSILSQTYGNLEIILVDDGSPDSSGKICDQYADRHKNIHVIHKENGGLSSARNAGLEVAAGDYIFFLDSDDYIEKDEIEAQYRMVKNNNVDACYVGCKKVDIEGKILGVYPYKDAVYLGGEAATRLLPRLLGSKDSGEYDRIGMAANPQIYSLKTIRDNNIRFVSERDYISEDLVWNIDFLSVANGAVVSSKTGCYYRQNPNSLVHQYREDRFEKYKVFYKYINEKISVFNLSEVDLNRYKKTFFTQIRNSMCFELDKSCPHTLLEKYKRIRYMCSDSLVQDVIKSYPVSNMGMQQKIYLSLVSHKMVLLLVILLKYRMRYPWRKTQ